MKKIVLLVIVVLVGLIWVFRQRVFLRDPLATMSRNEVEQHGVEVYMNGHDDVLLWKTGADGFRLLVESGMIPGTPQRLTCLRWVACLTDADQPAVDAVTWTGKGQYDPQLIKGKGEVEFVDGDGSRVRVELR